MFFMQKSTKTRRSVLLAAMMLLAALSAVAAETNKRALWVSINSLKDGNPTGALHIYNNVVLVHWRLLPGDTETTAFDLYRKTGNGTEVKLNSEPISQVTNWQDKEASRTEALTYRLTYAGSGETLDTYTLSAERNKAGLPYITIPLAITTDLTDYPFHANESTVGDLDGDGDYEILVKRVLRTGDEWAYQRTGTSNLTDWNQVLIEAYKLDGTFLWRVKGGPNMQVGNGFCAVADFDGDGCAEVAVRSAEGVVFGDGTEIGDTDGDGIIDYRPYATKGHLAGRPEFLSVLDGKTGKELARGPYIPWESSEAWGDDYNKRASSYRYGVINVTGDHPSILITRGVYARSVLEAWDYRGGQLTRLWHFDSSAPGGEDTNKDGKPNSAYASQGNHSLNVGDVDGDGKDEVFYGSMVIDHDGTGLWSSGLGHGDANHLGKFLPNREGLQAYHCLETGTTLVALHDAATGEILWDKKSTTPSDMGRAMCADIDPRYEGCEFWYFRGNVFAADGTDLGYTPSSCNMACWFTGDSCRQLLNCGRIDLQRPGKGGAYRAMHAQSYGAMYINGTKGNPSWYGDLLGDWREELIYPDTTFTKQMMVFSTWYPTEVKQPWLMSDHLYEMSALNQDIGYNQPTHLSYYFGTHGNTGGAEEQWVSEETLWTFDDDFLPGDTISYDGAANIYGLYMVGNTSKPMIVVSAPQTFIIDGKIVNVGQMMKTGTGRDLHESTAFIDKTARQITTDCCCAMNVGMPGKLYLAINTANTRYVQVFFNGECIYYEPGTGSTQVVEVSNTQAGTYMFLASGAYSLAAVKFVPDHDAEETYISERTWWDFNDYAEDATLSAGEVINADGLYLYGHPTNGMKTTAVTPTEVTIAGETLTVHTVLNSGTGRDLSSKTSTLNTSASKMANNTCCAINVGVSGTLYLAVSTGTNRLMQVYFGTQQKYAQAGTGNVEIIEVHNTTPGTYFFLSSGAYKVYAAAFVPSSNPTGIKTVQGSGLMVNGSSQSEASKAECYDLHGRRISESNLSRGLYIRNGKKYVIK